jgi:hypothetical protein
MDLLIGDWKNEFIHNGVKEFELCTITAAGQYLIAGEHWFDVVDYSMDEKTRTMSFTKRAVKPGDTRKFHNTVFIEQPDYLVNTYENLPVTGGYSLNYRRI